ncbi:MAG: hypothetical protein WC960_00875 [Bacteroidales bacterium]
MNKLLLSLIVIPLFSLSFCTKENISEVLPQSQWKNSTFQPSEGAVEYTLLKFTSEDLYEAWFKPVDGTLLLVEEGSYILAKLNEGGVSIDGITLIPHDNPQNPIVGTFITSRKLTLVIEGEPHIFTKE